MTHLTYLEAAVVGLVQGVSELFPVSSLGHNVLIPALAGGSWARDLNVAAPESPCLAFIVGLHVATAIALLICFWRDWIGIIRGFVIPQPAAEPEPELALTGAARPGVARLASGLQALRARRLPRRWTPTSGCRRWARPVRRCPCPVPVLCGRRGNG
jgi:undecaprenyl pyrophosphate phosphatase UppP